MNGQSNCGFKYALDTWKARQNADGTLVSVLAIATVVPVARFFISPGPASAWVMGLFLFAVCLACVRLLNSAAMVVKLQETPQVRPVPQLLDTEILDVYEHPGALDFQSARSTSAYWLATPGWQYSVQSGFSKPQQFSPESLPLTSGRSVYRPRSGRN